MPRTARNVIPGLPHHITHRGTNHQDIFFTTEDRDVYLGLLQTESRRYGLTLMGHCLMTNHVHLIGVPEKKTSLAKAVGRTHQLYAQYINKLHGRCGHLWQNRYFSCPLDEEHLWQALIYTERNPVRGGLIAHAWSYPWSSAAHHVGLAESNGLLDDRLWAASWTAEQWQRALGSEEDDAFLQTVRQNTASGRPIGSDSFLSKLEAKLGRRLRPRRRGRPNKP